MVAIICLIFIILILLSLWSCCVVAKESDERIRGE